MHERVVVVNTIVLEDTNLLHIIGGYTMLLEILAAEDRNVLKLRKAIYCTFKSMLHTKTGVDLQNPCAHDYNNYYA